MSVITKQAPFAVLRGYLNYPEMGVFHPIRYIHQYAQSADDRTLKVLDLGCGAGHSIDIFRRILPRAEWYGVDKEPLGTLHRPGQCYSNAPQAVYDHDFSHLAYSSSATSI
jgi:SAM-dependent methyltransferase